MLGAVEHPRILTLVLACVKVPDTLADEIARRQAAEIERRLQRNARRREKARAEVDKARDELASLLVAGREAGLEVKAMCWVAGVSRETAHTLLRSPR